MLWAYSAAFMFSVIGSGVLECLGPARFGFVVRVIVMWGLCVPVITLLVLLNRGGTSMLPVMWLIFSFFEAVVAAACLWRIRRAVAVGENWLHSSDQVPTASPR